MGNIFSNIFKNLFGSNDYARTAPPENEGIFRDMMKHINDISQYSIVNNMDKLKEIKEKTGYNDYQLWCLCLCGILTETGSSADHFVLDFGENSPEDIEDYKKSLGEWWSINNKEELISTIQWLESEGHSDSYISCREMAETCSASELEDFAKENPNAKNDFKIVKLTKDYIRDRALIAWDYGRAVNLCRRGYQIGYFTEEEAWNNIYRLGEKVAKSYNSWTDFGINFLIGRVFWSDDKAEMAERTVPLIKKLISKDGAWSSIPWCTK